MENNNLPEKKQSTTLSTVKKRSITEEVQNANRGMALHEATDEILLRGLAYGVTVLGIPTNKMPQEQHERLVIVEFLKKRFPNIKLHEVKLAFDYAAEGRFEADMELYGGTFSAKYVATIFNKYLVIKKTLTKDEEEVKMNNQQRAEGIISLLSPETREMLKDIGSDKVIPQKAKENPVNDKFQEYLRDFDELFKNQEIVEQGVKRYVEIDGKQLDVDQYIEHRLENEI
jgi:hypothetical protein